MVPKKCQGRIYMQVPVLCGQEKYSSWTYIYKFLQWWKRNGNNLINYVDGKQKEAIIHTSGRQNAVDIISLSLPIPRDSLDVSLEVSLGAISPTSPSNATVWSYLQTTTQMLNVYSFVRGTGLHGATIRTTLQGLKTYYNKGRFTLDGKSSITQC